MPSGLTLTQQPPLSPLVEIHADDTAHQLWKRIARSEAFQRTLVDATGDLLDGIESRHDREEHLRERGVTALGGIYAGMVPSLASVDAEFFDVLRVTSQFGASGRSVAGWHLSIEELADGPLALVRESDQTPTIAIHIDDAFDELRSDQDTDQQGVVVGLLADLAAVVDLRVVCGRATAAKLRRRYHGRLPVSEPCNAPPSGGEVATRVEAARSALDPDSRETRVLRSIAGEVSETASYHELYADAQVSDSRVKQCIGVLKEHSLVAAFGGSDGRAVELLAAGREYLTDLETKIGVQRRLSDCVSETGNQSDDSRVTPPAHEAPHSPAAEGGDGGAGGVAVDANRSRHHQVRTASRHRAAAAAAIASQGGVAVADHPTPAKSDPEEPHRHYDEDADRLVVGCQYTNPLEGWVCIALALANQQTFRHALPPKRLESGEVGDLLADHTALLRRSRCLGYLADADATGEGYRDALLAAAEHLRELTKDLAHGNYEDRDRFRGVILQEAHGLAGTMAHLCDLAGVELVREFRIPEFSRDFDADGKRDLATTIAKGATIQSRYRQFAAYRQLFETREEKVGGAITPTVDATDPHGELIGSFVIVGKGVGEAFADRLRRELGSDTPREDAPEFSVPVPVETIDGSERRHHAAVVRELCRQKSIRPTRAATSVLAALAGTPHDTAAALHNLAPETKAPGRDLRLDEVRFALETLDADRILPDMSKTALSRIVHTLLATDEPLAQAEIADRAGVSARSVRNHAATLAAFDFIRETDAGWRFVLPFRTSERGETILPASVATANNDKPTARDVLADALADLLDPARYGDPDDPVAGALFAEPREVVPALAEVDWLDPWVQVVRALVDNNAGCSQSAETLDSCRVATVGEPPAQASLDGSRRAAG